MAMQGSSPGGMLKTATSIKPVESLASMSISRAPPVVIFNVMYETDGPIKSRHVLTGTPGVLKSNGPTTPGVQIDVFVLHCEKTRVVEEIRSVVKATKVVLQLFIAIVFKMIKYLVDNIRCMGLRKLHNNCLLIRIDVNFG